MRRFVIIVSIVAVAAGASAAGAEIPYLPPGSTTVVAGTHVHCTVALTSVSCNKVGGLTATIATSGAVRVLKGSRTLFASRKPITVHANGGFANQGSNDSNVYCHVYRAGALILSCSVNGGSTSSSYKPGSHCFDISERQVVVCRYSATGSRHDLKTFPQP